MQLGIVLIGMPASGKTTLSEGFISRGFSSHSADEIRKRLTGDPENHDHELEVWPTFHTELNRRLSEGENLIIDVTNSQRIHRLQVLNHFNQYGIPVIAVWVTTPYEVCLDWNNQRKAEGGRLVPLEIMEEMRDYFLIEPPELSEGYSKIVKYDPSLGETIDLDAILAEK